MFCGEPAGLRAGAGPMGRAACGRPAAVPGGGACVPGARTTGDVPDTGARIPYATSLDFSTCSTNQYVSFESIGRSRPITINGMRNANSRQISIQKSF